MIGLDELDLFSQSIETRLQSSGVPKRPLQISMIPNVQRMRCLLIMEKTLRLEKRRFSIHVLVCIRRTRTNVLL